MTDLIDLRNKIKDVLCRVVTLSDEQDQFIVSSIMDVLVENSIELYRDDKYSRSDWRPKEDWGSHVKLTHKGLLIDIANIANNIEGYPDSIDECIEILGKHFRGLWSSVFLDDDNKIKGEAWSVTVKLHGELVECEQCDTKIEALHEALDTVEKNKVFVFNIPFDSSSEEAVPTCKGTDKNSHTEMIMNPIPGREYSKFDWFCTICGDRA